MGKRTYCLGFLTITLLIALLALACSKKPDADMPPQPSDSNTASESDIAPLPADTNISSESNEPNSPAPLELPSAGRITAPTEADREKPYNPPPPGLIMAIAYSDKSSVLIEDALLSEGDTLRGVKVIKISEGLVEFEKNGSRWIQRAGDPPPPYWSDPNH
jgi:hypothetical protein